MRTHTATLLLAALCACSSGGSHQQAPESVVPGVYEGDSRTTGAVFAHAVRLELLEGGASTLWSRQRNDAARTLTWSVISGTVELSGDGYAAHLTLGADTLSGTWTLGTENGTLDVLRLPE